MIAVLSLFVRRRVCRAGKRWHQLRAANDKDLDTTVVAAFDTPGGLHLAAAAGKDGVLHVELDLDAAAS